MKSLVLVIVLLGCDYVLGDFENPILNDKFMLSRLDLLSRYYRDNTNAQVTIEYYGTMITHDVKLDFVRFSLTVMLYTIVYL